jgi:hypothetical protein
MVDWHSLPAEQKAPSGFFPQEVPVQTLPVEQAVLSAQTMKQRGPLQTKGAQVSSSGVRQLPVASQSEGGV